MMRVYAHYERINNIEYRWRTLLQLGDSWDVRGTVIMKNPGSSRPIYWNNDMPIPIKNDETLRNLKCFDVSDHYGTKEWFEFSVDPTMRHVSHLIGDYLDYNKTPKEGIIQLFNLFNVIDASLENAINKYENSGINTIEEDLRNIVFPVYIGWGNLWKNKLFNDNAKKFFDSVKDEMHYLDSSDIGKNSFYHPQYLLGVGKNRSHCINHYISFLTNKKVQQNGFDRILAIKNKISKNGTNQWVGPDGLLVHEYYCFSKNGKCVKENGTISIGLKIDNEKGKYVLSVLSKGNHPDELEMKINDFCYDNGWLKPNNDASYSIDLLTEENVIANFMIALLKVMKDYRETDFQN